MSATATPAMTLTIVTGNGGVDPHDVMVHREGCPELDGLIEDHDCLTEEYESKHEAWLDYNEPFVEEGYEAFQLHFYPCADSLPDYM